VDFHDSELKMVLEFDGMRRGVRRRRHVPVLFISADSIDESNLRMVV
jgi:hypothetical protein